MTRVVCVAAGQSHARKLQNKLSRRHLYLNYGLLSLASQLERMGLDPIQIQGNFSDPADVLASCIDEGLLKSPYPIFLSVPSFYAVSWARNFISEVRAVNPSRKIIVGGRWVVSDQPDRLSEILGGVDFVAQGLGESLLDGLINRYGNFDHSCKSAQKTIGFLPPPLNYALLKNREQYQPSIEVSRGCGMGCSFCQEKDERLLPLKSPFDVVSEVRSTILVDDLRPMAPYFEASIFAPGRKWAEDLRSVVSEGAGFFQWRAEARVDSILPDVIKILAESGLKVIDLGLESADKGQLSRMKKTKNPDLYLSRASALIKAAGEAGLLVKVNVLLFAGETGDTVNRTIEWLENHRQYISGLSVGPVMCFGWPESQVQYLRELGEFGASPSEDQPVYGVCQLNLSDQICFRRAIEISKEISKSFMTASQYYALKSFSYFPRSYSERDFIADIGEDFSNYSFRQN